MVTHPGFVIWLTGLSGSGKTTLASLLHARLKGLGCRCVTLDGDVMRASRYTTLGFSKTDRNLNVEQTAFACKLLRDAGEIVIAALISPYRDSREYAVGLTGALEIFVDAPLEECMRRDPKGLYAKALRGEIRHFTGVSDPYEPPPAPALRLCTDQETPERSVERIVALLLEKGLIDDIRDYLDAVYRPTEAELRHFGPGGAEAPAAVPAVRRDCKYRRLFIAGLPKSGTTWLQEVLAMLPGYRKYSAYDPTRAVFLHDVTPTMFQLMPPEELLVLKFHTRYTPYNLHTLKTHVGRFVVLFRDLRDVVVSRYHHVRSEQDHRHHAMYHAWPREEALLHCMNIIKIDYCGWVEGWSAQAELDRDTILPLSYEELHDDPGATIRKVCAHFEMLPPEDDLLAAMLRTRMTGPADLKGSLAAGNTRRKGVPGDWRNYFTDPLKEAFKAMAGELLVRLGYEKDGAW